MAYALPYPGPLERATNWAHWAQVPRLPRTSEDKPPAEETRASPPNPPSSSADLDLTLTGVRSVFLRDRRVTVRFDDGKTTSFTDRAVADITCARVVHTDGACHAVGVTKVVLVKTEPSGAFVYETEDSQIIVGRAGTIGVIRPAERAQGQMEM